MAEDLEWVVEPIVIMDTRGCGLDELVLVKWKGLPNFESTWESARMISQRFPEFQLANKLNLLVGRDGRTPIITYRWRKHKLPSKDKEGSLNSLCSQSVNSLILIDYHME